jgi:hypothetical protein
MISGGKYEGCDLFRVDRCYFMELLPGGLVFHHHHHNTLIGGFAGAANCSWRIWYN